MKKYWHRKLLFSIFSIIITARNKVLKKNTLAEINHISFFRFLKIFRKKFSYRIEDKIIQFDPAVSGIGWKIYFTGSFEKQEQEICSKFIKKNSVVFDIGANIGLHTVFFSNIAAEGKVYAFEPSRKTYSFLLNNIKNIPNIIPLNIGLAKETEILKFYECENDAMSGLKNTLRSNVSYESQVVCFSGDDLFKNLPLMGLDFIKIDVEGLEYDVLLGMEGLLMRFMPIIFCEIYGGINSNQNPEKTIEYLINTGYIAFVLRNNILIPYAAHNDNEYNYFFIPAERLIEFSLSK